MADVPSSVSPLRASLPARLDEAIAELAARQYGVVARAQLREAGLSDAAIGRRVARGHLQRLHRGVYAVGHRALRLEARWLAAVLAGGPGAVLSHRSAAAAWGLLSERRGPAGWDPGRRDRERVDVTVRSSRANRQASFAAHECRLDPADVTRRGPISLTTIPRTLLDYAEQAPGEDLLRAMENALRLRRLHRPDVEAAMARAPGRRGLKPLRAALDALDPDLARTRSELERRAIALVRRHGLPRPEVNARLHGFEVDLLWRERRVVVELDGRAFHAVAGAFDRDRRRDAELESAGYRVVRFGWRHILHEPAWVAGRLADLLA